MRIAVVQHRLRDSAEEDARALAASAAAAARREVDFVVFPEVFSLEGEDSPARALLYGLLDEVEGGQRLIPHVGQNTPGLSYVADSVPGAEELGRLALVVGDSCLVGTEWVNVLGSAPDVIVLCPRSENDLQAEAALELAIGLSSSVAGLVIVAESSGAAAGEPGHGGSAIIRLGEVLAEGMVDDDLLVADVSTPLSPPEPREPLPDIPMLLKQRLAHHSGTKLPVDYPADLSDGPGQR